MNTPLTPRPLTTSEAPDPHRGTSGYAPSAVPMVVHRQILSELEGAKQHIQALTQDNQRLQKQNQELLVEIDRVVKSVRRLQGLAEHQPPVSPHSPETDYRDLLPSNTLPSNTQPYPAQPLYSTLPETALYPEEESTRLQRDTGGWWLILTILLIVVTAFGTGFLIVRPFLGNSTGTPNEVPQSNPISQ